MRVAWHRILPLVSLLWLQACASTAFAPDPLTAPQDLRDVQTRTIGDVSVAVAILTDDQARQHFGADFRKHELQAIWIGVRNASDRRLWLIRTVLEPDFYSAEEAALLVESDVPRPDRAQLHQHFRDESIRALLLPGMFTEGYVYVPRVEGGRYVDIRLQADAFDAGQGLEQPAAQRELKFDFALPLPDGDFDYEKLEPAKTYAGQDLPDLGPEQFRAELERLPCCVGNSDGTAWGDPLNIALVGTASDVMLSLSRSGWSFTHRITFRSVRREIGAAVAGNPYAVAPVSSLYVFGRRQDVALQRARRSISQRNHLRLWLAPFRFEGRSVWVGQISRDIGIKATTKSPTLTTHVIDPQVDTTREYLLHNLIGHGFVDRFGFVAGAAAAPRTEPRYNLTGDPYFSDGMRLVVVLAPEPVAPDEVRNLMWERSAAPIAEGQSEAAQRHVRPLDPP